MIEFMERSPFTNVLEIGRWGEMGEEGATRRFQILFLI